MVRSYAKKQQQEVLMALAQGASKEGAAQRAGVSARTVYRWLQSPEFCEQLRALQSDIVRRTMAGATAAGLEAIKTGINLLDPSQPGSVRVGAMRVLLEYGLKLRHESSEERLAALERQVAELGERLPPALPREATDSELPKVDSRG